jgi:predicted DNA-binding transcriptional regulator YafY
MPDGSSFVRRALLFIQKLRDESYVNKKVFADEEEISPSTVERLVDRLRDDFGAPLKYDETRHSFYLEDPDWSFPCLPSTSDEFLALALARHHLKQVTDKILGGHIDIYWERLRPTLLEKYPEALLDDTLYSVGDSRLVPVSEKILKPLLDALVSSRRAIIQYRAPFTNEESEREVSPWHLRFEEGRWYLLAYCHLKIGFRKFQVIGINSIQVIRKVREEPPKDLLQNLATGPMGKYSGINPIQVTIRVSPPQSRYIADERWPAVIRQGWKGEIFERTFLAGHLKEAAGYLLSLGSALEVISPKELRAEIAKQAKALFERHSTEPND